MFKDKLLNTAFLFTLAIQERKREMTGVNQRERVKEGNSNAPNPCAQTLICTMASGNTPVSYENLAFWTTIMLF